MSKNRIQIDGVWYVRETEAPKSITIDPSDLTKTQTLTYENNKYCWEAIRIYKDDGESFYDTVNINFTDKRTDPWKEDYWDNNDWFIGVYENNKEDLEEARKAMDAEGIAHFQAFLKCLKEEGWL